VELDQVQVNLIVGFLCLDGMDLAFLQVNIPDIHDLLFIALALHVRQYLYIGQQ